MLQSESVLQFTGSNGTYSLPIFSPDVSPQALTNVQSDVGPSLWSKRFGYLHSHPHSYPLPVSTNTVSDTNGLHVVTLFTIFGKHHPFPEFENGILNLLLPFVQL